MADKTLLFETSGLNEEEYITYTQGVLDTLFLLGVEWWCDETPPDLSYYLVHLDKE